MGGNGVTLIPGTFWLDWTITGALASGPWSPPISILGTPATGNSIQRTAAGPPEVWQAVLDGANVDDLRDHRPGLVAAAEHGVRHLLVEAGFGKRVMFGSDQMNWPGAIDYSIESITSAPFLTQQQKRDILHDNAARFLRLSDGTRLAVLLRRVRRRAPDRQGLRPASL